MAKAEYSESGSKGVIISGQAVGLNGESGWLFDYDPGDHTYYEDYQSSRGPIVTINGSWSFTSDTIGNSGGKSKHFLITIVRASSACNSALLAAPPDNEGTYKFTSFPSGCQIDDQVDVVVTWS
jgi:hypothetical protein